MPKEKRRRSVMKAITYRLLSITIDSTLAYLLTNSIEKTIIFVIASNTLSIIMYFIHERAWNRVSWGRHELEKCIK